MASIATLKKRIAARTRKRKPVLKKINALTKRFEKVDKVHTALDDKLTAEEAKLAKIDKEIQGLTNDLIAAQNPQPAKRAREGEV